MNRGSRRRLAFGLVLSAAAALSGCNSTKYYERKHHNNPVMSLAEESTEVHFWQKCFYSREGSVGGIGTSAGGGCGCY